MCDLWASIVFPNSSSDDELDFFVGSDEIVIENPRRFGFTPVEYFITPVVDCDHPPSLHVDNCTPPEEFFFEEELTSHLNVLDEDDIMDAKEFLSFLKGYFEYYDAPTPISRKKRCPKKSGILLRK
jgi:hypothetical protein